MKKKFLLIPMLAGVMLAASCSKDDGTAVVDEIVVPNETPEAVAEQPAAQKTYPFSVQASKETSISKIALDGYDLKFDGGETLLLVLEDDETKYVELDFVSGAGTTTATFSKDLSEDEKTLIEGKKLWGVIKGKSSLDEVQYSTTSLEDAVNQYCSLRSTEAITYEDGKASDDLTLADEKAYIEFNVADGQKQVSLKRADKSEYSWYPVNEEKDQVWLAVPGAVKYNTRLKNSILPAESGKVYTLKSADVMDLGPDFSVLWATCNLGATTPTEFGNYYSWGEIITKTEFTSENYTASELSTDLDNEHDAAYNFEYETGKKLGDKGFRMPTKAEAGELFAAGNSTQEWKAWKSGSDDVYGYEFTNAYGTIFLPACGFYNASDLNEDNEAGYYWSTTYSGNTYAWCVLIANVAWAGTNVTLRTQGKSIRPVRSLN